MANYATLKSAIQQVVKTNGNNEITGALLQQTLFAMVNSLGADYQFAGIALPKTNPGTPDQNVAYLAGPGTYTNFNSLIVPDGNIGVLRYNGSWTLQTVVVGKNYDANISYLQGQIDDILGTPITFNIPNASFAVPFVFKAGKQYTIKNNGAGTPTLYLVSSVQTSSSVRVQTISSSGLTPALGSITFVANQDAAGINGYASGACELVITAKSVEEYAIDGAKNEIIPRLYGKLTGIGKGTTTVEFDDLHFVPGEKYRIMIPTWDHSGFSGNYVFGIAYRAPGATSYTNVVRYLYNANIPSYYDFTAVDADNYDIYFRAISGTKLTFGVFHQQLVTLSDVSGLGDFVPIRLLNNFFLGAGNSYVARNIYGLKPGYKYRVIIRNKNWDHTGVTSTSVVLFGVYSYRNGASRGLIVKNINSAGVFPTIEDYYEFTVPENSDYIAIGGRAANGEKVEFMIVYNSLIPMVDNSFNSQLHSGLTDWKTPCQRFSALMKGDTVNNVPAVDKCDAFVFFTDPHTQANTVSWAAKFDEYMAQLQKVYNSTPTEFVLCGGDWLGNGDTPDQAAFKMGLISKTCYTMLPKCYLLVGNHDTNYQGKKDADSANYTTRLPNDAIRNLWYYWNKNMAYYTIESRNTKFYCFDTGVESQTLAAQDNYGYNQASWFAQSLLSENFAHIAIAMHIYRPTNNSEALQPLASLVMQIAAAYNSRGTIIVGSHSYDYSAASGKVEFAIAGHSHLDAVYTYTNRSVSIPVIITTDMGYNTTFPENASFDLVFVDYDNRKITCVRVGSGSDREIPLT